MERASREILSSRLDTFTELLASSSQGPCAGDIRDLLYGFPDLIPRVLEPVEHHL